MPHFVLRDVLMPNLRIVFGGTAAGDESARIRQYYANPTNCFWKTLYQVGLTSRQLLRPEFTEALNFGLGPTDLAKCHAGCDSTLKPGDFDLADFRHKIEQFQPRYLAFNGKKAAQVFYGLRGTRDVEYGVQNVEVGRTKVWVLPSTSRGNGHWNLEQWQTFAASTK